MSEPGKLTTEDVEEVLRKSFESTQALEKDLEAVVKTIFEISAKHKHQTPMRVALEAVYFAWQLLEDELLGEDEPAVGLARSIRDIERGRVTDEPDWLKLANQHGGPWADHPGHPLEDWKYQVTNGDTRMGYWEWVLNEEKPAAEK